VLDIERIEGLRTRIGESPVWDARSSALWLVDILAPAIVRVASDGVIDSWETPQQIAAVALTAGEELAVLLDSGFTTFDPSRGAFGPIVDAGCRAGALLTEGKVDRVGRFVGVSGDRHFRDPIGALHRWEPDGSVTILDEEIVLGNSLCWNRDGTTMYVADSIRGVVYAYDYGDAVGARREFARFDAGPGFPDGATVDTDDHMWTVLHGSPWIVRLAPDGSEAAKFEMPTRDITSLAFGGAARDELYVTSLDPSVIPDPALARAPETPYPGAVYRVRGAGATGIAEPAVRLRRRS
jgi:sugar lactone lactonase YvrE